MSGPIDWAEDDPDLRIPAEDMTVTPAVPTWGGYIRIAGQQGDTVPLGPLQGESTSAALRRTQQALAASQADLSQAVQGRNDALSRVRAHAFRITVLSAELASARIELEQLRHVERPEA